MTPRGWYSHEFEAVDPTDPWVARQARADRTLDYTPARALGEVTTPTGNQGPHSSRVSPLSASSLRRASRLPEGVPRDSSPRTPVPPLPVPPLAVPQTAGVDLAMAVVDQPCGRAGDFTNEEEA